MSNDFDYDVIVVGGGMVGAALACALSDLQLRILVVESAPRERFDQTDYDLRVSAITNASKKFFQQIGVWENMVARRAFAYEKMHVWDANGTGEIEFDAAELGEPALGHMIENRVTQAALLEKAEQRENIRFIYNASPKRIDNHFQYIELSLFDGKTYRARLIVGADGGQSWVRGQLGISTRGWSYGQKGVVATITTENEHANTAYQRFLPAGPLAFLPLADKTCSIVWSTTESAANRLLKLETAEFEDELNAALGPSPLGRIQCVSKRVAFPLRLQHALHYCKSRAVLVGDAAHTIHPLAGQGVNLGFADASELVEQIRSALQRRGDIGEYLLLRRYERARKADNLAMMAMMDGFKRLFSNERQPLVLLRNIGLNLADRSGPVKRAMMRRAMGLSTA